MKRLGIAGLVLALVCTSTPAAAFAVTDVPRLIQEMATVVTRELGLEKMASSYRILRRWARRLAIFENLSKYVPGNVPQWRVWRQYDPMPEALAIMNALNAGVGTDVEAILAGRRALDPELTLPPEVRASLAALDVADSVLLNGIDQAGRIRGAEDHEEAALDRLQADVISTEGSATARLDVLTAAALLRTRQQQTRLQLLLSLGEQLTVDTLRDREAAAIVHRMRVAALTRPPSLVDGDARALRTWRMP